MVYELKTHSINAENFYNNPTFSLMIDTLEIVVNYKTREILYVQGFLPLIKAKKSILELPLSCDGKLFLNNIDFSNINEYDVFSLTQKIPQCKKYFEEKNLIFDDMNGIIQLGSVDKEKNKYIKISNNLIIGYDYFEVIKTIYIIPDRYI